MVVVIVVVVLVVLVVVLVVVVAVLVVLVVMVVVVVGCGCCCCWVVVLGWLCFILPRATDWPEGQSARVVLPVSGHHGRAASPEAAPTGS